MYLSTALLMNIVRTGRIKIKRCLIHVRDHCVWEVVSFSQCSEVVVKLLQLILQLRWQLLLDACLSSAKYQKHQHMRNSQTLPDGQGMTTYELVSPTIGGLEAQASFRNQ